MNESLLLTKLILRIEIQTYNNFGMNIQIVQLRARGSTNCNIYS